MRKILLIMVLVFMFSCAKGKNESASFNVEENSSKSETVAAESGETAQVVEDSKLAEDSQKMPLITEDISKDEFYAAADALFDDTDETYIFSLDNPEFSVFAFKFELPSKELTDMYCRYIFNKDGLLIFIQKIDEWIYGDYERTWERVPDEELITIKRGKRGVAVYRDKALSMLFLYEDENNFYAMTLYEGPNKIINQFAKKQDKSVYFGYSVPFKEAADRRLRITQNGDDVLFNLWNVDNFNDAYFKVTKENEARLQFMVEPVDYEYIKKSDNVFNGIRADKPDSPLTITTIESRAKDYQISVADIIIDHFYGIGSDYPII